MQLNLFDWHIIVTASGLAALSRLDFEGARSRFMEVLKSLPEYREAECGLRNVEFWEHVFVTMGGLGFEEALSFLWTNINGFSFDNSGHSQILRHTLVRRLQTLLGNRPTYYDPPSLCSGYLHLQLEEYVEAETDLRLLLADRPNDGLIHFYLAESLWLQGRTEAAGPVYAGALLLAPQEISKRKVSFTPLQIILQEFGPELAPVYGYLNGVLPLVQYDCLLDTAENRIYRAMRRVELARSANRHQEMVDARRILKSLSPEIFKKYLEKVDTHL